MVTVIGVRFRKAGKIYYFAPDNFDIKTDDHVVVETARGIEYGEVVIGPRDLKEEEIIQPLKKVIRIATPEDDIKAQENKKKEKKAFDICIEKIVKHKLEMKLIDVEYTFDNNKVLFYFTAEGRIDFRELVKDLASVFKTRIELRQIGVRDETKMIGSIGICGRALCCSTHLCEFQPVSIKMAKEQNLSLNPSKISGVCGRLMCCLKYEEETYEELNKTLPAVGDKVKTVDHLEGEVLSVNVLRQKARIIIRKEDGDVEIKEYKSSELQFKKNIKKQKEEEKIPVEDLMELVELEKIEEKEGKLNKNK
ncbi:cell fate regulator YaaT (PSP1 superfamily) [Natranaerovirga hydrolytica]|uniref:Cell fate regulator YaaT (PSP1 superfamily) n=1 Tax=Natranaerovirga hydrolytica TaxID=680378 RepID=A0A4R1N1M5_9FIRM|nr:stage 0 sporulation family protein [Natranaerovirga hydrolytica]TCL00039.1 cell fate regulator YaaT (PSP1 superfamily) [Natranaerovirga hydrolytica]